MNTHHKCELQPCKFPASVRVQWGSERIGVNEANMCDTHHKELWDKINPHLQLNRMWYSILGEPT